MVRLARTSRCAVVGSGTRKARAISAVDRPATSLSVSAARLSGGSPGWEHVKINRSRSSAIASGSLTSGISSSAPSPVSYASASERAPARRSRRRRSSARRRAVVRSQAPGRSGVPSAGQRSSACANASWTTSSAVSMSRTIRSTDATTRPYSRRNTSATRACTPSDLCPRSFDLTDRHDTRRPQAAGDLTRRSHLPDRPHLDEAALAERDLLRPLDGFLLCVALDQVEATQRLLRLGEGAVHDLAMPGLDADAAGVAVWTQALAHDHLAGRLQLVGEAPVALHDGLHLGPRGRGRGLVVGANEQHVTHGPSSHSPITTPMIPRNRQSRAVFSRASARPWRGSAGLSGPGRPGRSPPTAAPR